MAAPFIRVRDPLRIIPFLFIDPMKEPLMNIAIGVYGLESKLFYFDLALNYWLARNVFIIVTIELGTFRGERRMFENLIIISASSSKQQSILTHCRHVPPTLFVMLYFSTISLLNGVVDIACRGKNAVIKANGLYGILGPS